MKLGQIVRTRGSCELTYVGFRQCPNCGFGCYSALGVYESWARVLFEILTQRKFKRRGGRVRSFGDRVIDAVEHLGAWIKYMLRLCDECPRCETYVCPWCARRVPWSDGCADGMPESCDDCWSEAHAGDFHA